MTQGAEDEPTSDLLAERKMRFLFALRSRGVTDTRVLTAMEKIDRGLFVRGIFADRAYEDMPLPIACGQTISQPSVVGLMTQALNVQPRDVVLEVGTGSGYQAAILSKLSRFVYSVERYKPLLAEAEQRFKTLRLDNVITRHGDGSKGWPEQAPFDRIMVTAAAPHEPHELIAQLKPGGVMVAPVGKAGSQFLHRYVAEEGGSFRRESLIEVRFVPLVDGVAREG